MAAAGGQRGRDGPLAGCEREAVNQYAIAGVLTVNGKEQDEFWAAGAAAMKVTVALALAVAVAVAGVFFNLCLLGNTPQQQRAGQRQQGPASCPLRDAFAGLQV